MVDVSNFIFYRTLMSSRRISVALSWSVLFIFAGQFLSKVIWRLLWMLLGCGSAYSYSNFKAPGMVLKDHEYLKVPQTRVYWALPHMPCFITTTLLGRSCGSYFSPTSTILQLQAQPERPLHTRHDLRYHKLYNGALVFKFDERSCNSLNHDFRIYFLRTAA